LGDRRLCGGRHSTFDAGERFIPLRLSGFELRRRLGAFWLGQLCDGRIGGVGLLGGGFDHLWRNWLSLVGEGLRLRHAPIGDLGVQLRLRCRIGDELDHGQARVFGGQLERVEWLAGQ
jgi:hypothetical protein